MKDIRANIESYREKRERERDRVVTEFEGDARALADEVIYLRRTVANVAKAVGWAQAGAPFGVVGPGPYWQPRRAATDTKEVIQNDG
jgi:hypothetical protein